MRSREGFGQHACVFQERHRVARSRLGACSSRARGLDPEISRGGSPPAESQEFLSESHQSGSITSEAIDTEPTHSLTPSSNGSSLRKIEVNRNHSTRKPSKTPIFSSLLSSFGYKGKLANWGSAGGSERRNAQRESDHFLTKRRRSDSVFTLTRFAAVIKHNVERIQIAKHVLKADHGGWFLLLFERCQVG